MENLNETVSKAGELYEGNYHCCEAIVLAVSEHFDCKDDLLLKISTPFGGEMRGMHSTDKRSNSMDT
jgi:hypothetical protein